MARRRNPRWPWILVGSAAVVVIGGVSYVWIRRHSAKKLADRCPPGKHVGDPGFRWPYPQLFLDETGFGEALEVFGYDVGEWNVGGWDVCSPQVRQAVEQFQRDYNLVWQTIEDPVTDPLALTGLIDSQTVLALAFVDGLQQLGPTWPLVVEETKEAGVA